MHNRRPIAILELKSTAGSHFSAVHIRAGPQFSTVKPVVTSGTGPFQVRSPHYSHYKRDRHDPMLLQQYVRKKLSTGHQPTSTRQQCSARSMPTARLLVQTSTMPCAAGEQDRTHSLLTSTNVAEGVVAVFTAFVAKWRIPDE